MKLLLILSRSGIIVSGLKMVLDFMNFLWGILVRFFHYHCNLHAVEVTLGTVETCGLLSYFGLVAVRKVVEKHEKEQIKS